MMMTLFRILWSRQRGWRLTVAFINTSHFEECNKVSQYQISYFLLVSQRCSLYWIKHHPIASINQRRIFLLIFLCALFGHKSSEATQCSVEVSKAHTQGVKCKSQTKFSHSYEEDDDDDDVGDPGEKQAGEKTERKRQIKKNISLSLSSFYFLCYYSWMLLLFHAIL